MLSEVTSVHLRKEFKNLRVAMRSLDKTLRRLTSVPAVAPASNGSARRFTVSPKRRAFLVLQGRYMGYMRQLKPRQKAQVKRIRDTKGVERAIAKAKHLAKRA